MHYYNVFSDHAINQGLSNLGFNHEGTGKWSTSKAAKVLTDNGWTRCDDKTQRECTVQRPGDIYSRNGEWFIRVSPTGVSVVGTNRVDRAEFWTKVQEVMGERLNVTATPPYAGYHMEASFPTQMSEFELYQKMQKLLDQFGPGWGISMHKGFIRIRPNNGGSAKFVAWMNVRSGYMVVHLKFSYA